MTHCVAKLHSGVVLRLACVLRSVQLICLAILVAGSYPAVWQHLSVESESPNAFSCGLIGRVELSVGNHAVGENRRLQRILIGGWN